MPTQQLQPRAEISDEKYRSLLEYLEREQQHTIELMRRKQASLRVQQQLHSYESTTWFPRLTEEEMEMKKTLMCRIAARHQGDGAFRSDISLSQSSTIEGSEHSFFLTSSLGSKSSLEDRVLPLRWNGHRPSLHPSLHSTRPRTSSADDRKIYEYCREIKANDASIKIQRLVRMKLAVMQLIKRRELRRRVAAATIIAAAARGMLTRKRLREEKRLLRCTALAIRNKWKVQIRAA